MSGLHTRSTRRRFLKEAALLAAVAALPARSHALNAWLAEPTGKDEAIAGQKFALAREQSLTSQPIGDVIAALGRSFIGTPYVAHTLEVPGPERLVVNLRGVDCTTFVEYTLALARCVKLNRTTFEAFQEQLRLIRYRSGVIQGYPSRLHYFVDWIGDNEKKNIVREISRELGGQPLVKTIDFMSKHRRSYKQLSQRGAIDAIRAAELRLSSSVLAYVPKAKVAEVQDKLQNGDVIAIVTSIPGLDVSHTGLIAVVDGIPRYLHAPLSGGSVQLSQGSLADYLARGGKQTGITVARPLEPDGH